MASGSRNVFADSEDRSIRLRRARSFYDLDGRNVAPDLDVLDHHKIASGSLARPSALSLAPPSPVRDVNIPSSPTLSFNDEGTPRSPLDMGSISRLNGRGTTLPGRPSASTMRKKMNGLGLLLHSHSETDLTPPKPGGPSISQDSARAQHLRSKRHPSDLGLGDLASHNIKRSTESAPKAKVIVHVVQATDTLAGLSLRYGISAPALRKANRLWANDSVQARKEIYLPVSECHRLKEEDLAREVGLIKGTRQTTDLQVEILLEDESSSRDPLTMSSTSSSPQIADFEHTVPGTASENSDVPLVRVESLPADNLSYFPPARRKDVEGRKSTSSLYDDDARSTSITRLRSFPSGPRRANTNSWEEWLGLVHSDADVASRQEQSKRSTSESSPTLWNMPMGSSHYLRAARTALGHSLAGRLSLDAVRMSFDREYRKSIERAREQQSERNGKMELVQTLSPERATEQSSASLERPPSRDSSIQDTRAFERFSDYHRKSKS